MSGSMNSGFSGVKKPRVADVFKVLADGVKTRDLLVTQDAKVGDDLTVLDTLTVEGVSVINDQLTVNGDIFQWGYLLLPKFTIVMYSGTVVSIPEGWLLCDGRTETINGASVTAPDLRGRFVLSYGQGPLDFVNTTLGATGGEQKHTLTSTEMPSHTHTTNSNAPSIGLAQRTGFNTLQTSDSSAGELDLVNAATLTIDSTGGGEAHNTMPPYYTLCFIMKGF